MDSQSKAGLSLICLVTVIATLAGCSASPATLPPLTDVIALTSQQIASDLHVEMAAAKQLPRLARNIRTASVEISEMADMVVVEASRLPPIEHLADMTAARNAPF